MSAPETYPVALCIRAAKLAMQDCDAATPEPWEAMGRFIDGPSDVLTSDVRCGRYCYGGSAEGMSLGDVAFAVLARAGFRAALEYVHRDLLVEEDGGTVELLSIYNGYCTTLNSAIAPLIQHYDATRPGWRTE